MPKSLHDDEVIATLKNVTKSTPSPVDWRDHWIYFLMIDRFNNLSGPPKQAWNIGTGERQGGTFKGITDKLAYIKELGAGAIWLTPVLKNCQFESSHHGYGIQDFLEIDPRFGSEQDLIELIKKAHDLGLYVILDIVINHAGNVFAYDVNGQISSSAPWNPSPYKIYWRDENGKPRTDWSTLPASLPRNAGIWPSEFQNNDWFRRQGVGGPIQGDFETLKEFKTELSDEYQDKPVWNLLIQAHQYIIAKFDVDGFRIDTFRHIEREFALTFSNAIREFALSIGKENFFIFGEVKSDKENELADYVGRHALEGGAIGADAALDFPLQWKLGRVSKGFEPPTVLEDVFNDRKEKQKNILSSHGEASNFFVTFLDCHDDPNRFFYPKDKGDYSKQLILALSCLFGLQGIPCLYYGTEQGLKGTQDIYASDYKDGRPENVREALWGKPDAFNQNHPFYQEIKKIAEIRKQIPALRYGRQYFRPISGNGTNFGFSKENSGIIAFSRILNGQEVVIIANTNVSSSLSGWVLVDSRINDDNARFYVIYSNCGTTGAGTLESGDVTFYDRNNCSSPGWARRLKFELAPMEIQVLVQE
jgi:glycosidase